MKHPEIERKFLVRSFPKDILNTKDSCWIRQGFLSFEPVVERIRVVIPFPHFIPKDVPENSLQPSRPTKGWRAFHDIKRRNKSGDWRSQTEEKEEIALWAAWLILDKSALAWLTKVRYRIPHGSQTLELDIFMKPELRGLVILEVELSSPEEDVVLPESFDVVEVTEDPRFRNVNLAQLRSLEELHLERIAR